MTHRVISRKKEGAHVLELRKVRWTCEKWWGCRETMDSVALSIFKGPDGSRDQLTLSCRCRCSPRCRTYLHLRCMCKTGIISDPNAAVRLFRGDIIMFSEIEEPIPPLAMVETRDGNELNVTTADS